MLLPAILILTWLPKPAAACGPYSYYVDFSDPRWPDDLEAYVGGDLGVPGPHYDERLLWVAYRHLKGLPVGGDKDILLSSRFQGGRAEERPYDAWKKACEKIPGVELEAHEWFGGERRVLTRSGTYEYFEFVINCQDDAFLTATRTLEARAEEFGVDSPEIREWLRGQHQVFSNCTEGRSLPPEAAADWPRLLKQDRAYQRAAAYFYSEGYADAERRFREIAADADSPWSGISHYLVARALGRQNRYEEAIQEVDGILANGALEPWHGAARGLRDHYLHRHDPEAMRAILTERLTSPERPGQGIDQDLEDLPWVLELEAAPQEDLMAWLFLLRRGASSWERQDSYMEQALERWLAGAGSHWWLAAAMLHQHDHGRDDGHGLALSVIGRSAGVERLLEKVPAAEGPGRLATLYHRLRLERLAGRLETPENETLIEAILGEELTLSDRNRFLSLHRDFADDLETWLRRSFLRPDGGHYDDASAQGPGDQYRDLPVQEVFDPGGADLLDRLSPGLLFEVAGWEWLTEAHRARLARSAWLREILLGNWRRVAEKAGAVAELWPDLATDIRSVASAPEAERPFQASLAILRDRRWDPHVHRAESWLEYYDGFVTGRSWWCAGDLILDENPAIGQRGSGAEAQTPQRLEIKEAPLHFASTIFEFADNHGDDPRVPEALHRLVRSTRFSCGQGMGEFGPVSKEAFRRLHKTYPKSPWTKKTPHWFD